MLVFVWNKIITIKVMLIFIVYHWKVWNHISLSVIVNNNIADKNYLNRSRNNKRTVFHFLEIQLSTEQSHIGYISILHKKTREQSNIFCGLSKSRLLYFAFNNNIVHRIIKHLHTIMNAYQCRLVQITWNISNN